MSCSHPCFACAGRPRSGGWRWLHLFRGIWLAGPGDGSRLSKVARGRFPDRATGGWRWQTWSRQIRPDARSVRFQAWLIDARSLACYDVHVPPFLWLGFAGRERGASSLQASPSRQPARAWRVSVFPIQGSIVAALFFCRRCNEKKPAGLISA